jgi:leucyl aminopeptidase
VGAAPTGAVSPEALRRAVGAAVRELAGTPSVALAVPADDVELATAAAEGALLGAYAYRAYRRRTADAAKPPVEQLLLITSRHRDRALAAAVDRAHVVAEAVAATRDLVNCPPVDLYPASFADAAREQAAGLPVKVTVLDETQLAADGYGGLLGVGQGSVRPPRLVKVAYAPRGASRHVALVGKGITFDSGGLSIKPAQGMETMKLDMAGAAAVLQTVLAAARLRLRVRVTGWLCLAENMPSATAQRPSDVITIYGGRTVEVLNTDAEGRLVLADGIVAAAEEKPDAIVDIATLTGAQMIALGNRVSAVMGSDDDLVAHVRAAADAAGEQVWPMPLPEELRGSMDSPVADIANVGERFGGMLVAGLFLREFVPTLEGDAQRRVPWAHLDIAGPAFNESSPHGYTGKGGTGVGVRTLLTLLEDVAAS